MKELRHIAVIDIGKTNIKVAVLDLRTARETAIRRQPNKVLNGPPYPHYDVDNIWRFLVDAIFELHQQTQIDAISITTHGATAALLNAAGELAFPILDYEYDGFGDWAARYEALRPSFEETGSPRLPMGLNLGTQIYWQQNFFPKEFAQVKQIVMYPQYWAFRLTGIVSNEVTSLGCHTDLWNVETKDYSSLIDACNWRALMAPMRRATEVLGTISSAATEATGLDSETPVAVGIHDSNASLVPHLLAQKKPFSVVSTGTWVISMAIGGSPVRLDSQRDTLMNTNALNEPVPSARFMGGREFEILTQGLSGTYADADVEAVLKGDFYLLPSVVAGCGPFPNSQMQWIGAGPEGQRQVVISFYLAMMTATCLNLVGAQGGIILEGPFAKNILFCKMLQAATGRAVLLNEKGSTGTTIGAALLLSTPKRFAPLEHLAEFPNLNLWQNYARRWNLHQLVAMR
jgi:sugar (pentulose or hexulose) kinase